MKKSEEQTAELTDKDIVSLHNNAKRILSELVTSEGIYASVDSGWRGPYHSWFGRDSAITADLICASIAYGGDSTLADRARHALLSFTKWQGKKDDEETGEERGKFPHEIRHTFNDVDHVQHTSGTNEKPWYVDPSDGYLKNWDSVDSTPLWVIAIVRVYKAMSLSYEPTTLDAMRQALEWILRNLEEFDGFIGFIGADLQTHRKYSGLHNQGWKDSFQIYQNNDGSLAKHPIMDVLVNGEAWSALDLGSEVFAEHNSHFSLRLRQAAEQLKMHFNSWEHGFLLPDRSYYAQAIDGNGEQLPELSADVAMNLWAYGTEGCIIEDSYVDAVIEKVTRPVFFNPRAGIRDYATGTVFAQGTRYHGNAETYWPFVSALIARGLDHFAYSHEAAKVIEAYLIAIHQLGTNIEMFIETSDYRLLPWHHPDMDQQSAVEQAWTAAAVYYGTLYLLNMRKPTY